MRNPIATALLACALTAATSSHAQLIEDYRFKGEVVDTQGKPVGGVQVTFRETASGQRISFKSGEDGTFDRRMIPHGIYEVTFEKAGYTSHQEKYDWSQSAPDTILRTAKIVLESPGDREKRELEQAKAELSKKASKLYEGTYAAFNAGNCSEAQAKAAELLETGAGTFEYAVRFIQARCLATGNDLPGAENAYRRVVELKPDMFEAHYDLALVLERQSKHKEALEAHARASELKPSDANVHYEMGAILFRQGQFDQALPHLEKTVELNPEHGQACKALGFSYLSADKRDLAKALVHLTRYLELEPDAADKAQVSQIIKELK